MRSEPKYGRRDCEAGEFGRTRRAGGRFLWFGRRACSCACVGARLASGASDEIAATWDPSCARSVPGCFPPDSARRRRGRHNVTPREDYRTASLSDSPDTGCSLSTLAAGESAGTTRAVSTACGVPQGERLAVAVVPSACIPASTVSLPAVAGTRTRALRPLGRGPEAPTVPRNEVHQHHSDHRAGSARENKPNNKTIPQSRP